MITKKKILGLVATLIAPMAFVTLGVAMNSGINEEVALSKNQSYTYAYITEITGNEITYSVLEDSVVEAYLEQQEEAETADVSEEEGIESVAKNIDTPSNDIPESDVSTQGEPPSGNFAGERPEMSSGEFEGERPEMPSGEFEGERQAMLSGEFAGEIITTLLPVGITVHTQSETQTTFQRLAQGDMIKMLVETTEDGEEVITEIWML